MGKFSLSGLEKWGKLKKTKFEATVLVAFLLGPLLKYRKMENPRAENCEFQWSHLLKLMTSSSRCSWLETNRHPWQFVLRSPCKMWELVVLCKETESEGSMPQWAFGENLEETLRSAYTFTVLHWKSIYLHTNWSVFRIHCYKTSIRLCVCREHSPTCRLQTNLFLVGVNQGWNIVTHLVFFIGEDWPVVSLQQGGSAVIVLCKLHFCC
jgi:hypothetical protein